MVWPCPMPNLWEAGHFSIRCRPSRLHMGCSTKNCHRSRTFLSVTGLPGVTLGRHPKWPSRCDSGCRCMGRFKHPAANLVFFHRFEQGLEVAFAKAITVVALALDEFKEHGPEHGL